VNAVAIAAIVISLFAVLGGIAALWVLLLTALSAWRRVDSADAPGADWDQPTPSRSRPHRAADLIWRARSRGHANFDSYEPPAGGPGRIGDDAGDTR
jgi:hypothetical protein